MCHTLKVWHICGERQHTPKSPLNRGDLKKRYDGERQHTPKSPLDRGDLKKRYDGKMQHTPKSLLDRWDLKKRIGRIDSCICRNDKS